MAEDGTHLHTLSLVPPREVGTTRCPIPPTLPFLRIIPTLQHWHPRTVRGARGRERRGPTRSHPEPGRDPRQRRRVLWTWSMGGEAAASPPDGPGGTPDVVATHALLLQK